MDSHYTKDYSYIIPFINNKRKTITRQLNLRYYLYFLHYFVEGYKTVCSLRNDLRMMDMEQWNEFFDGYVAYVR